MTPIDHASALSNTATQPRRRWPWPGAASARNSRLTPTTPSTRPAVVFSGEMARFHPSTFSARSVWALLYLIVFGSILAFTTYTWLLDHCSPTLVSTHTYANPIIAVLLGWALAGETLDARVLLAGALTLLAVFLISRGTSKKAKLVAERAEEAA